MFNLCIFPPPAAAGAETYPTTPHWSTKFTGVVSSPNQASNCSAKGEHHSPRSLRTNVGLAGAQGDALDALNLNFGHASRQALNCELKVKRRSRVTRRELLVMRVQ